MKKVVLSTASYVVKCFLYGIVGAAVMLLIVGVRAMNNKPDLQLWHTVGLDEEFTEASKVSTFAEYLALEDRLFNQLDASVYAKDDAASANSINRYTKQSLSDATSWETNWNRSFELKAESPKAGVLLLHGLTDAPYSLLGIGERLHAEGAYVVGLRIPGHGTVPSALTETTWQDMAAAVRLAMRHLKGQVGEQPLYVVGYSNGGALSVRYALESITDTSLPVLDAMVLLSPEIGITSMAGFAIWQERIGDLLRLNKLQWTSVLPEYDPYKYTSFPANAGMLAHNLTIANRTQIRALSAQGKLGAFPRVLAFQSIVDSTVLAPALVKDLFAQLPEGGHDLVIYDINRFAQIEALIVHGKVPDVSKLEQSPARTYTLTFVTNENPSSENIESRVYPPAVHEPEVSSLGLKWPRTIYSLSHVALPFSEGDAIYGVGPREDPAHIHLGAIAIRGEKGVLAISAADMLRQRWNPFYQYQVERIVDHFMR